MTPIEFLDALNAEWPRGPVSKERVPAWLVRDIERSGKKLTDFLDDFNTSDGSRQLLACLRPRLPALLLELFDCGFIACAEVNDPLPKVYVKFLGEDGCAIVFNSGLKQLIYRVARIIATRFVPNTGSETSPSATPNLAETARLLAEVFWWLQETGQAFGPDYPIQPNQVKIASLLATEAESFLIAHEIGHVVDEATRHGNPVFRKIGRSLTPDHRAEHAADAIGLVLALELHNEQAQRDPFRTPLIYAGIEFTLQIYKVLDRLGFEVSGSHPAALNRLDFIRSEMKGRCASDATWEALSTLASGIEAIFAKALEIIEDPGEHEAFFDHEANQIVSRLDQLLTKCTGGFVPDYMEFYAEAGKIFDAGYPHEILERAARVAADFVAVTKDGDKVDKKETWIRFQKFKLVFAFAHEHMPEPARSLFLRSLGAQ